MRKKFTMLLAALFLVMGTAWAEGLVVGQHYRLKNVGTNLYMHNMGKGQNLKLQKDLCGPAQFFCLEAAEEGKYYLKAVLWNADQYVNASGWDCKVSEGKSTPYTIALVAGQTDVYTLNQVVSGNKGNIGVNSTSVSVDEPIYCNKGTGEEGQWKFEAVDYVAPVECTFAADKTYRIRSEHSGLYMELVNYTAGSGEGHFQMKSKSSTTPGQCFSFVAAADGKYCLKTVKDETDYYVNISDWNFVASKSEGVPFKIETVGEGTHIYSLKQETGNFKGYAGNDKSNSSDGKYAYIFNNVGDIKVNTIWSFEEVVKVEYHFKNAGKTWYTQVEYVTPGSDYPDYTITFPWGVAAAAKPTEKVTANIVHDVEMSVNLPFNYAEDYAAVESNGYWYYFKFDTSNNYYLRHTEGQNYIALSSKAVEAKAKDFYSWGFVGNPFDGFQIVNRGAGSSMILSSSTTMAGTTGDGTWPIMTQTPVPSGNNTYWIPTASSHATNGFFLAQKGHANNRMNNRGKLAYWTTGAGAGSTFVVEARVMGAAADLADLLVAADVLKDTFNSDLVGEKVGNYSQASYDALLAAISKAEAIADADVTAQDVEGLRAAVNKSLLVLPVEGKYYYIVSQKYTDRKMSVHADKYMYFDATDVTTDVQHVFQFQPVSEGMFHLYNVGYCTYLNTAKGHAGGHEGASASLNQDAVLLAIDNMGSENIVKLTPNGGAMLHAQSDGKVVAWDNQDHAGASAWTIVEVPSEEYNAYLNARQNVATEALTRAEELLNNSILTGSQEYTALQEAKDALDVTDLAAVIKYTSILQTANENADKYIKRNDITYVTALPTENSNHPLTITPNTSAWAVNNNGKSLTTIGSLGLAADAFDLKQQFAIITIEGSSYLYSINAKRFVKKDNTFGAQGDPIQLNDASSVELDKKEYRRQFQFVGTSSYINVNGSNDMAINGWSTLDRGNACLIVSYNQLTFDLDEALDVYKNHAVINVTYKLGEKTATTSVYKEKGETYNINTNNPYGFTSVVSCTNNGEALAANDGVYSFEITGDANVVVEIQENLPFTTTTITDGNFAAGTEWYVLRQRWNDHYWEHNETDNVVAVKQGAYNIYEAKQLWCFTGNAIDGFKVYNKAAGATFSLNNDSPAKLAENNDKVWEVHPSTQASFDDNNARFGLKRPGGEYANLQDGTLKKWSLDAGSTTNAISVSEKYAEIAANWEKMIMAGAVGSIIGEKAEQMRTLIDAYVAAPSQANEDVVNNFIATVTAAEDLLQLKEGSYYMVVSANDNFFAKQGVEKAIYSDGTDLRWGTRDNLNRAQIWKAIKVDGKWRFQNFKDMLVMVASKTDAQDVFVQRQDDVISDYTADIKLENIQNTFTQWNVKFEEAVDNSMHANGHNSGNGGTSNIILHGGGNASDPSAWRIMEMSQEEVVSAAKAELNGFMTTLQNDYYDSSAGTDYKWRDQPGVNNYTLDEWYYNSVGNLEAYYNAAKAVYDSEESTVNDVETQISLLSAVLSEALTINLPEEGKFYRLRCVAGQKYVSADISSSRFEMQDQDHDKPAHIFMYDGEALLSFSQGLYMNHQNFNAIATKSTVAFTEAANGAKAQYNIKVGERYIYGEGDTQNNHIDSGTGSPTSANEQGYNWCLEEVTSLPVVIGEVGYATFYTPVAVEIPEDENFTASIISEINGDEVVLQKVTDVVPAGTGLILEAGQGTYNFNIATEEAPANFVKGHLKGTMAKSIITAEDNTNYYVLANTNDKVGLYKAKVNREEDGNKVDEGGVAFLNNANRVYLPVATSQGAMAPAMFRFRGKEQGTTEIEVPATNDLQPAVIYDLTGRRITEIVEKGIYIVNGKKVVIK